MDRCLNFAAAVGLLAVGIANPVHAQEPQPAGKDAVLDLAEEAMQATVRIEAASGSGTGFVVALDDVPLSPPRFLLVTAAHTFDAREIDKCTVIWRTRDADGVIVRTPTPLAVRDGEKRLWVRHPNLDIAVVGAELPGQSAMRPFAYRQLGDETLVLSRQVRVGQEVWIPCFPANLEGNPAGWPILRKGAIATYPLAPLDAAKTIAIDYPNFGGDSGAPVVAQVGDRAVVVALVFGMHRQTIKTSSPVEERTVHTPLGLALAVQAPFIRQTIDLWRAR